MNSITIKLSLILLVAAIGYSNADSSAKLVLPGMSSSLMNSGRGLMSGMVNNMASRVSSGEFQPAPVVITTEVEEVRPGMFGRIRNSLSNRMGGLGRILRTIGQSKLNMIKFIIRIPGLIFKMVKNIFSQVYYSAKRNNVTPMGFLRAGRLGITGNADKIPTAPIPGKMMNAAESALAAKLAAEQQMINSMGNMAGQAYGSMGQAASSMGNMAESAIGAKLAAEQQMINSMGNMAGQAYDSMGRAANSMGNMAESALAAKLAAEKQMINSMGNMAGQAANSMGNMAGNLGAQLPSVRV